MAPSPLSSDNINHLKKVRDEISHGLPRITGRIRKLLPNKRYGFIAGDDGQDYFFHESSIQKVSERDYTQMRERDRIEFSPIYPQDKGPRAIECLYVEG